MLAPETVMLDPLAVSEPLKLLLCPTVTLPKLNVAGLTANWPETRCGASQRNRELRIGSVGDHGN